MTATMSQAEVNENQSMPASWAYVVILLLQVAALEKDATEVLSLILAMKNSFAPINRIPPALFSIIPKYWCHAELDKNLATLTHVCRGWRELLIARSWLWARLDYTNIAKTHVFIRRAKASRLKISLRTPRDAAYLEEAFFLIVPQARRFKSLSIF